MTVHFAVGLSDAGLVRRARHVQRRRMVTLLDDFSVGPLQPLSDPAEWWTARRRFWESSPTHDGETRNRWSFLLNERVLAKADRIVVWATGNLGAQLSLLWLFRYLPTVGADADVLRLASIQNEKWPVHRGSGVLRGSGPARWPRAAEARWLDDAWDVVTAPDPQALNAILDVENPMVPRLTRALAHLVFRYPSTTIGLTLHDEVLLASVKRRGRVAWIIGHTLARLYDLGDRVGDWVLFDRLRRLGAGPRPAVVITGGNEIRDTEARLTEDGARFLTGKQNYVELNGVDEWVAGVHLDSSSGRVWYRKDGRAVPA